MEFHNGIRWNTRGMSAIIPAEFQGGIQGNVGSNSAEIPGRNPAEFGGNVSNYSRGIPQWNPEECRQKFPRNSGGMPAIVQAEFHCGIPPELTENSARVNPEFWRNTGGIPAIIPRIHTDSPGIRPEFQTTLDWTSSTFQSWRASKYSAGFSWDN